MKATKVNAGLTESSGRLLLGIWRDSLHVTCGLTACTPGSAPGPALCNEYGKTLPLPTRWLLDKLQSLQNAAACLVTGARKFDHITPVMREPHWLYTSPAKDQIYDSSSGLQVPSWIGSGISVVSTAS